MAVTEAGRRLTLDDRARQLAIRARSIQGLMRLWKAVDPADLTGTIEVFTEAAVLLAMEGRDESAEQAARYLKAFRSAEGASGRGPDYVAPRPTRAAVAGEVRGAALSGIISARRAGAPIDAAKSNGLVAVTGALIELVLTGGWMTILGSTARDPVALGWQRVTSDEPCAFCRMLAGRGPAYKSKKTAGFTPHDGCSCTAEPVYHEAGVTDQSRTFAAEFATAQQWAKRNVVRTEATSNNALNNYRQWLAAGKPKPGASSDARRSGTDGSNPE